MTALNNSTNTEVVKDDTSLPPSAYSFNLGTILADIGDKITESISYSEEINSNEILLLDAQQENILKKNNKLLEDQMNECEKNGKDVSVQQAKYSEMSQMATQANDKCSQNVQNVNNFISNESTALSNVMDCLTEVMRVLGQLVPR